MRNHGGHPKDVPPYEVNGYVSVQPFGRHLGLNL